MKLRHYILVLLFCLHSFFNGYCDNIKSPVLTGIEIFKELHLVPIYAADTRAHRLGIQRDLNASNFMGSMGGQFQVYNFKRGRHIFQFEIAGTTYLGLQRSISHGSVINTDFYVDGFLNYKWHRNWALRLGTGHTSHHLSDDAIVNGNYSFKNYARDYHQLGLSYLGQRRKFHVYTNIIYNYNFKTDQVLSGKSTFQTGFECNLSQILLKSRKETGLIVGADFKFKGELNYRTTNNLLIAYQFFHNELRQLKLVFNYTSGADERGQFYQNNRSILSTGIHAEF